MRDASEIQADLDAAYASRRSILTSQSYSVGSRSLSRAQLSEVNSLISELNRELNTAEGTGGGVLLPMWRL